MISFEKTEDADQLGERPPIRFERSRDWEAIKRVITHPRIWPAVTDDNSVTPEEWTAVDDPSAFYVMVKDDAETLGLFALYRHNAATWHVHTCLLPCAWGPRARDVLKKLAPWVWDNVPAARIITEVPQYNTFALKFAIEAGMTVYGVNPQAYLKGGKLYDITLLGISRPGVNGKCH